MMTTKRFKNKAQAMTRRKIELTRILKKNPTATHAHIAETLGISEGSSQYLFRILGIKKQINYAKPRLKTGKRPSTIMREELIDAAVASLRKNGELVTSRNIKLKTGLFSINDGLAIRKRAKETGVVFDKKPLKQDMVIDFIKAHPNMYTRKQLCAELDVKKSLVDTAIFVGKLWPLVVHENKQKRRHKLAEDVKKEIQIRRVKSEQIAVSAKTADLLLSMPPPNFSGMSNTQSRSIG